MDTDAFVALLRERLGITGLDLDLENTPSPGGDADNVAHTHASDDLRSFVIEYLFTDEDERERRRTLIHELLHVAFRHVASVAKHVEPGAAKAWQTQAIEEDTEALAEALERWIDIASGSSDAVAYWRKDMIK